MKFRPIMDLRKFFDRTFDAELAAELADLGYAIKTVFKEGGKHRGEYYSWDIEGIPDSLAEKASRRSRQEIAQAEAEILAKLKEQYGEYSPAELSAVERAELGATSRRTKCDDLTLEECREYGPARRAPTPNARKRRRPSAGQGMGLHPRPENRLEAAVSFSMRHHFEKEAAVPVEELATTALEHAMGSSARTDDVERELNRQGVIMRARQPCGSWRNAVQEPSDGRRSCTTEAVASCLLIGPKTAGTRGHFCRVLITPRQTGRSGELPHTALSDVGDPTDATLAVRLFAIGHARRCSARHSGSVLLCTNEPLLDQRQELPRRAQDHVLEHLRNYVHSTLGVSWLTDDARETSDLTSLTWRRKPVSVASQKPIGLPELDVSIPPSASRLPDRLKTAISELGYDAVIEDLSSPELIGGDDSLLPSSDVMVILGHLDDAACPILLATTKCWAGNAPRSFAKVMRPVKARLIESQGAIQIVIVFCEA